MKKNIQNKELSITKLIFQTILKTVWVVLFCVGFLIMSLSVVAPRFVLNAYDIVGFNKAGYLVQKRLYLRDNSNENLYNLIQRAIEMNEYEDQAEYITIMLESEDYDKFRDSVDEATKKTLGERYSIYADNYDAYLRRHLVSALYKTGDELEAKMLAIDSVYGSLDELHEYVNLVVNDENLTEMQKKIELTTFNSRYPIVEKIEEKMTELNALPPTSSIYDEIIILNQKIKMAEIQFELGNYAEDNALKEQASTNLELWRNKVQALKEELN